MINSALLSAQNRKRCYWTNIPDIVQPEDKGILLNDILECGIAWQEKSYCMTVAYTGAVLYNTLERKQRTMVAIPINTIKGKAHTLTADYCKIGNSPFSSYGSERGKQRIAIPIRVGQYGNGGQGQRIYSVHGKSVTLSANGGGQAQRQVFTK